MSVKSKMLAVAAVAIMMASIMPSMMPSVTAADDPTLSVANVTASPGETVDVDVRINGTELSSFRLSVTYDTDVIRAESVDTDLSGHKYVASNSTGFVYTWFSAEDVQMNGTVALTISFLIPSTLATGLYRISASVDQAFNVSNDDITLRAEGGSITVVDVEDAPKVSIQGGSIKPGEQFTAAVRITGVTLTAFKIVITYPQGYVSAGDVQTDLNGLFETYGTSDSLTIVWATADDPVQMNGTVFTAKFNTNPSISATDVDLGISCDEAQTFDASNSSVTMEALSGKIRIVDIDTHLDVPDVETIRDDLLASDDVTYEIDPSETSTMTVDKEIFDDLSDGQTITFVVKDKSDILYTWSFTGTSEGPKTGDDVIQSISIRILQWTDPTADMAVAMDGMDIKDHHFFSIETHGQLPYSGKLKLHMGTSFDAGTEISLYYLGSEGLVDKGQKITVDDDGFIELTIDHFSEYALFHLGDASANSGDGDDDPWIWVALAAVLIIIFAAAVFIAIRTRDKGGIA